MITVENPTSTPRTSVMALCRPGVPGSGMPNSLALAFPISVALQKLKKTVKFFYVNTPVIL
jgi:hypothetical protein